MLFGKINLVVASVFVISFIALLTDIVKGKIYNYLTLPSLLLGLCYSVYSFGLIPGILFSVLGITTAFLLFGWIYKLGFMGGGDVKFLMALGAWGGYRYAEEVAIASIAIGGLLSFLILFVSGRIFKFLNRLNQFFLSIYVKELEFQLLEVDKTLTMPFGIPMAIAAVWVIIAHPLEKWGILWP